MRSRFVLISLLLIPAFLSAQQKNPDIAAIQSVFDQQIAAWNRGDLEGFMTGYWKSPDLSFYGSSITHGWQETLDHYRQGYKSQGKEMGTLSFSDLHIELLGPKGASAWGGWHLKFSSGKEAKGLTTLILRKFPEGWRIVHDHSSSEQ